MNREQRRKAQRAIKRSNKKLLRDQEKKIKETALEFVALEKAIQAGENVKENQNKIEKLSMSLSYPEIFAIDEYIESNHLLTK